MSSVDNMMSDVQAHFIGQVLLLDTVIY